MNLMLVTPLYWASRWGHAEVVSMLLAKQGAAKADHFAELAPWVRFMLDTTVTLVAFVGAVSGATAINDVCPIDDEFLCYRCPAQTNFAPSVPDSCKLPVGSTSTIPFECPSSCPAAFKLTIANGGFDGSECPREILIRHFPFDNVG